MPGLAIGSRGSWNLNEYISISLAICCDNGPEAKEQCY